MLKPAVAAALFVGLVCSAQAGVTQKTNIRYFAVHGATAGAIYRSVAANSTLKENQHTLATNEVHMATQILTKKGKDCKVGGINVEMTFEVHLPKLDNEAALAPPVRRDWRAFVAHLQAHELHHRALWMTCAAGYHRALQKAATGCGALSKIMKARWSDAEEACRKTNDTFDAQDEKVIRTLPFIRRLAEGQ